MIAFRQTDHPPGKGDLITRSLRLTAPLLLLLCCLVLPLQAQEADEEERERLNSIELFFGFVTETAESATGGGIGLEYNRRISPRWRLGIEAIEISTTGVSRAWLVVVPAYFDVVGGLGVKAGLGVEGSSEKPEDGDESETTTDFLVRFGAGWEFELGRRFVLIPEANLDLVGGSATLVYGVSFGLKF